jgi:mRNA interferase RelE/StbE
MHQVLVSRDFQKQFNGLTADIQNRVRKALKCLEEDPIRPRSGADIKSLEGTNPQKYRIRVGDYRIVYVVQGQTVKVLEIFIRGRDYRA